MLKVFVSRSCFLLFLDILELMKNISIIIPAYNESSRIGTTLKNILSVLGKDIDITVVFDGSDDTPKVVESVRKSQKATNLSCNVFNKRLGKWGAIIEGINAADKEIIVFMDADEAVPSREVKRLIELFPGKKCDIMIASRRIRGAVVERQQPFKRRFSSKMFNLFNRFVFNLQFYDTQCGFKIFESKVAKTVAKQMKTRKFEGDVEFLWIAQKEKARIREEGIVWKHVDESTFALDQGFGMLRNLFKVRFGFRV